jgi:hypothetical protein
MFYHIASTSTLIIIVTIPKEHKHKQL